MSKSPHEMAMNHIILATSEAEKGNHKRVQGHLNHAKGYAESHCRALRMMGQHDESNKYMTAFQNHMKRIQSVLISSKKKNDLTCSEDHSLVKTCTKCGYMNKSLEKIEPKQQIKVPGQDPRYKYKAIHELSSADQASAYHKFQNKQMGQYLYPVDEKGGLVHASRAPMPKDKVSTPKPLSSEYNKLQPHHLRDSSVRINAPGHPMHGKLGIVQGADPSKGGKVTVRVGTGGAEVMHFDPEQVGPSRPINKIEKALVAYWGIQKALLKR